MNLNLWIYLDDWERKFPEYKREKYFRNILCCFSADAFKHYTSYYKNGCIISRKQEQCYEYQTLELAHRHSF